MSGSVAGLVYLQVLFFAIGVGALPLLRLSGSLRETVTARAPLAYPVGVALTGILGAHLALIHVPLGLVELTLLALVVLAAGLLRASRTRDAAAREEPPRPAARTKVLLGIEWPRGPLAWLGLASAIALAVLLVAELRAFAVRPLLEFDGWAIWATKARALYEFGGTFAPVFESDAYPPLQHPLLLPSLEAMDYRAMGAFDPALMHVQLVLLAAGFAAALVTLLNGRAPFVFAALGTLAVLSATGTVRELATAQADAPLALLVALGVVALACWLTDGDCRALVCAVLFLGAATLTKSEGALFALAAFAALFAALLVRRDRARATPALVAFAATAAILAPWRIFVAAHHLKIAEYEFANLASPGYLVDHADRAGPAAWGLLTRMVDWRWTLLWVLALTAIAGALVARRRDLAVFAAVWIALSYLGLVLIYWISNLPVDLALRWSGDRTITSIVLGGAALAPLLVGQLWPAASEAGAEMRRTPASARPSK